MKHPGKILIIDDDHFSRCLYADLLRGEGHEIFLAESGNAAMPILKEHPIDLVITDLVMPGMDGLEVLNYVNENHPHVDVIVTTGYAAVDNAVKALKSGAKDFLRKPINAEEFRLTVERCLEQRYLFTQNQEFRSYLNLFEACHRISGCLEVDRLLPLSLNALGQELEAQDGLLVYREPDGATKTIFLAAGTEINFEEMEKKYQKHFGVKDLLDIQEFTLVDDPPYPKDCERALTLPVFLDDRFRAVFFLFYYRDSIASALYREALLQRAQFIGRQIALSMENAMKFSYARGQAYLDDLTGLHNSKHLFQVLKAEVKRCDRFNQSLSVLFLDLDHFKEVNDRYGHLAGSKTLIEVGEVLKSCLREIDTAVRYGGDEYTAILINTDSGGATKVAERIRRKIEAATFLKEEGLNIQLTVCIGIASFPEHAKGEKDLIELADKAMYRGKKTTRNVVYITNPAR